MLNQTYEYQNTLQGYMPFLLFRLWVGGLGHIADSGEEHRGLFMPKTLHLRSQQYKVRL